MQKELHGLSPGAEAYLIFFVNTLQWFPKQRQSHNWLCPFHLKILFSFYFSIFFNPERHISKEPKTSTIANISFDILKSDEAVEMKQPPPPPPPPPPPEPEDEVPRPDGSMMTALATPSASPAPPSSNCNVTDFLSRLNTACAE